MKRMPWLTATSLLFLLTTTHASEVESYLFRPSPAIDPDARGTVKLENDQSGPGQKFVVDIDEVDANSNTYTLWIEEPLGSNTFQNAGEFVSTSSRGDKATYERRTDRGQSLPLNAQDLLALADRKLEVRDSNQSAILLGSVPQLGSGSSGGGSSSSSRNVRSNPLLRPANAPIPSATGHVEAQQSSNESELEIEAEHFDVVSVTYTVWIEDGLGAMQNVGALPSDRGRVDQGKLSWKVRNGQALPLGAASVSELADRRVEIRNPQNQVVLEGRIPDVSSSSSSSNARSTLSSTNSGQTVSAKGNLKVTWQPKNGKFRLDVRAKARTTESTARLFIENPTSGLLEEVAQSSWTGSRNKQARWSWRTDRGQALPHNVVDPSELFGKAIEVRDESGQTLLSGTL